jgi:hypothetical protein
MCELIKFLKSFLKIEKSSFFTSEKVGNISIIKKERSFIFIFENLKIYFTVPKKTPKKEGYFVILYKLVNGLSVPLLAGDVDYILIAFDDGFYLIPLVSIPSSKKKKELLRGLRIYHADHRFRRHFYIY